MCLPRPEKPECSTASMQRSGFWLSSCLRALSHTILRWVSANTKSNKTRPRSQHYVIVVCLQDGDHSTENVDTKSVVVNVWIEWLYIYIYISYIQYISFIFILWGMLQYAAISPFSGGQGPAWSRFCFASCALQKSALIARSCSSWSSLSTCVLQRKMNPCGRSKWTTRQDAVKSRQTT